jgi:Na+/H+ antiporter NhaD/arsenite permease-like protein
MGSNPWITLIIVTVTFIGIAVGRYPFIKSNRTTITLIGVALLVIFQQIQFTKIPGYIDFDTIILLFSMMIIIANLKLSGFFGLVGNAMVQVTRSPRIFLAIEIFAAGILSALFLNDTICLMFAPFILTLMDKLKRNPIPYLIGLATAANVGSTATLTGNPQNMIIGVASKIPYIKFILTLAPVALLGMVVIWIILVSVYPLEFKHSQPFTIVEEIPENTSRPLLIKTILVASGLLVAFLAGAPIAMASFLAACFLLITRRHLPQAVFSEIDWNLLVFFAAMFVVSGSLETGGVTGNLIHLDGLTRSANIWNLTAITAILSNLISNVPAVMLLKPVIASMPHATTGWLTVASASTLAGNLTLLGSVANLIVAETAARWRVDISFWEYTKSGFIITLITLLIGATWLSFVV